MKLKNKYFKIKEFANSREMSVSRAYAILNKLIGEGKVVRLASNLYKFSEKSTEPKLNRDLEKIKETLWTKGFNFSFTGMSVLEKYIHHIPYSVIYHIYIKKGSGDSIKAEIKRRDIALLLDPSYDEVVTLIEEGKVNEILVIRENNYLALSKEGVSSYEKALIDLYFEVTRGKIPFMKSELYYLAEALIFHDEINFSQLFTYAKIRKIFPEIINFIKKLSETSEIPKEVLRKYKC